MIFMISPPRCSRHRARHTLLHTGRAAGPTSGPARCRPRPPAQDTCGSRRQQHRTHARAISSRFRSKPKSRRLRPGLTKAHYGPSLCGSNHGGIVCGATTQHRSCKDGEKRRRGAVRRLMRHAQPAGRGYRRTHTRPTKKRATECVCSVAPCSSCWRLTSRRSGFDQFTARLRTMMNPNRARSPANRIIAQPESVGTLVTPGEIGAIRLLITVQLPPSATFSQSV